LLDHFATEANHKQTEMLKRLPKALHSFISLEIYMDFINRIPFLEPFIEMNPLMIQEIAQGVEKKNIPDNNFLFEEGCDGIYFLEEGIVTMDGFVYPSGSFIGLSCLRTKNKVVECRAITDVKSIFLPRAYLIEVLDRYPKVKYYINRWTIWQVLREYIRAYSKLYYMAARRGATMSPPLLSKRPNMEEDEDDDIDIAVLDHIEEMGF
jgi:CRP-like cAMP-binding protein